MPPPKTVRINDPNDVAVRLDGNDLVLELLPEKATILIRRTLAPEILDRALSLLVCNEFSLGRDDLIDDLMSQTFGPPRP